MASIEDFLRQLKLEQHSQIYKRGLNLRDRLFAIALILKMIGEFVLHFELRRPGYVRR